MAAAIAAWTRAARPTSSNSWNDSARRKTLVSTREDSDTWAWTRAACRPCSVPTGSCPVSRGTTAIARRPSRHGTRRSRSRWSPDFRIGWRDGAPARIRSLVLWSGRAARLAESSVVHDAQLMVALDAEEGPGGTIVRLASAALSDWLFELYPDMVEMSDQLVFNPTSELVERVSRIAAGSVVIDEERKPAPPSDEGLGTTPHGPPLQDPAVARSRRTGAHGPSPAGAPSTRASGGRHSRGGRRGSRGSPRTNLHGQNAAIGACRGGSRDRGPGGARRPVIA